ncbi:MAG: signal peptide peptidase SppA [Calditrichaeota bacterium]|nr:MAG: signal peptide peptidase SppA [Calditrichota bacterium]
MYSQKKIFIFILIFLLVSALHSQEKFTSYFQRYPFLNAGASSHYNGLLGFVNPANAGMVYGFNTRFYWTAFEENGFSDSWGFYSAVPHLSFGVEKQGTRKDYRLNFAWGNRSYMSGLGYQWSSQRTSSGKREKMFSWGNIMRPVPHLSIAFLSNFSLESSAKEGVLELGIRPFRNPRLTLFGDMAFQKGEKFSEAPWSIGAVVEPISGVLFTGRYFDGDAFQLGIQLNLGKLQTSSQSHFSSDNKRQFTTFSIGMGDYYPSAIGRALVGKNNYLSLSLKGRMSHLSYQIFDEQSLRLYETLESIRIAAEDPGISVIALNLSGLRILPEHAWELREELLKVRSKGKKIVVYIDNAGMRLYHLASVADVLMMDPMGMLTLPGYLMGRTFLKGTLEKLGLEFDEWRFFKFKSAAEVLSREQMSEADRQQRQQFIDQVYDLFVNEVSRDRGLSSAKVDSIINQEVVVLARKALETGLVDTLCGWNDLDKVLQSLDGEKKRRFPLQLLKEKAHTIQLWGEPPQIALVYALGVCDMDEGIRARWLAPKIRQLADNPSIKAVVLRVDSPGGDGLASDLVAREIKRCAEKKPVVISQGQVAASGGYWISMYGDTIIAGPGTITGSIGVIGGWLYDKGFSSKLGMTSDHVQKGEHADVGFGITLPFLGIQIPSRNLTSEERQKVEELIKEDYHTFVKLVADGRGLPEDSVARIAEGRFYTGAHGKEIGLVDELGNLMTAISIAKKMAHLADEAYVQIQEVPPYKGFLPSKLFSPFSTQETVTNNSLFEFLKFFSKHNGKPLPMVLPGDYPEIPGE